MTLHEQRNRFERTVAPVAAWCARRGLSPNQLTAVSMLFTGAASIAFLYSSPSRLYLLAVAASLLGLGAFLDSADGVLARMTDQASAKGDYLDHAVDRFADVAVLLGITFSPWATLEIGLFAVVGTLLTSYMGTQAQAVGVGRDYGGLLGRADRIFILFFTPLVQIILELAGYQAPFGLNVLYLGLAWIAVAGNITAIQRFWAGLQDLDG